MIRLLSFLAALAVLATGLAWLADRPGSLVVDWQDVQIETTVFHAVVLLALLMAASVVGWALMRGLWQSPAVVGQFFTRRRQQRGLDALSSGLIAIGSGDNALALRHAQLARKALPNEPLTHLLRAQAAQLAGDRTTARRIYEAMLGAPDTEQLGLRGLYLEAEREGEKEAARQFAERALGLNPRLGWASSALFDLQCKASDWEGALEMLVSARRNNLVDKAAGDRRRAVLLTAQAQALEDGDPERAAKLAEEAHRLANDLVPAAVIAGRVLASRGNTAKVAKIVETTWRRAPHPDLATVYAFSRVGDSPRDRLDRIRKLAKVTPNAIEGPLALASAAVEARNWEEARLALEPLASNPERITQRVCSLMARIESEQDGNAGKVREWLARAVNAPRDPAWTAEGYVFDAWAAVSPVTGALDVIQWRVPGEALRKDTPAIASERIDALIPLALGTGKATPGGDTAPAAIIRDDDPVTVEAHTVTVKPEQGAANGSAGTATKA